MLLSDRPLFREPTVVQDSFTAPGLSRNFGSGTGLPFGSTASGAIGDVRTADVGRLSIGDNMLIGLWSAAAGAVQDGAMTGIWACIIAGASVVPHDWQGVAPHGLAV